MRVTHNIQGYYNPGRLPLWWFLFVIQNMATWCKFLKGHQNDQVHLSFFASSLKSLSCVHPEHAVQHASAGTSHYKVQAQSATCKHRNLPVAHFDRTLTDQPSTSFTLEKQQKNANYCNTLQISCILTDPPPSPQHGKNISKQLQKH